MKNNFKSLVLAGLCLTASSNVQAQRSFLGRQLDCVKKNKAVAALSLTLLGVLVAAGLKIRGVNTQAKQREEVLVYGGALELSNLLDDEGQLSRECRKFASLFTSADELLSCFVDPNIRVLVPAFNIETINDKNNRFFAAVNEVTNGQDQAIPFVRGGTVSPGLAKVLERLIVVSQRQLLDATGDIIFEAQKSAREVFRARAALKLAESFKQALDQALARENMSFALLEYKAALPTVEKAHEKVAKALQAARLAQEKTIKAAQARGAAVTTAAAPAAGPAPRHEGVRAA